MNTYEAHGRRTITFRQAHANSQDVAVVEEETFEEHDTKIRIFRRNHPNITEIAAVTMGGVKKALTPAVWRTLIPLESNTWLKFSTN